MTAQPHLRALDGSSSRQGQIACDDRVGALITATYIHHVPGRLRVKLQHLKNDAAATETVCLRLSKIAGVRSVKGNTALGSLTILYDEPAEPDALLGAIGVAWPKQTSAVSQRHSHNPRRHGTSWKDLALAGMTVHLVFDLVVWATAAGALMTR
ncbi:HMA2 domain-containing protein [Methylobacterium nodulans]|uniref:Uncharacterized protein n=1 Tax=Methylobacterium nodulans (strain LMG 21967 / CNCM I-2342 / ORS 2060) TaxID=460265 RepID=B8IRK8_METNO|nr:heavy-metal-associated domain-containing protein [Methylobacterium nodulans]ACL60558.1 hypothetical protein Mnod_5728 [Methylobacterium nodulans ORS 2060]